MTGDSRANCPITGEHCQGRQALIDMQTGISVELAACQPNIIHDGDGLGIRAIKHLANMASSTTTTLMVRGMNEFSAQIDTALSAEPAVRCEGSLCGSMGNLVVAYSQTFMPEHASIRFGAEK